MAEKKEEKKEAEKAPDADPDAVPSKKKKLIIFAGAGLLVVAAIGGGAAFFLGKGKTPAATDVPAEALPADKTEGGQASEKKDDGTAATKKDDGQGGDKKADGKQEPEKKPADFGFGKTMALAPFHLNLGNPIDSRYVRLEIAVEYGDAPGIEDELKGRMPQLRDAVVSVTRKKSREFLLGPDGTDQLRLEIKNRINQYMKKPIDNVYVTDILIE